MFTEQATPDPTLPADPSAGLLAGLFDHPRLCARLGGRARDLDENEMLFPTITLSLRYFDYEAPCLTREIDIHSRETLAPFVSPHISERFHDFRSKYPT
ncbi:MAG: hypothetical protein K9L70_00590 [Thiohalocapsa sp.]|nr:hypothetical protein [Thiohalocapsa sp.]MCF7990244.1 hypothetical protein [Thiohalocapsa sp.]